MVANPLSKLENYGEVARQSAAPRAKSDCVMRTASKAEIRAA